ncbi:hypothetical protein HB860_18145 [Aeromonas sp. 3925]|uniref:hypothetical protein n=1 Tax=Aeromonas TaxID=642 RepID=UPI001FFC83EC|nr:hypothetical protein [Aeromonas genomosp. paramedia]MCK2085845.1 hypothetical protein [Aeromonas genomosp. paramedia]
MNDLPVAGFTLPPFMPHSYPGGTANTASYPGWLRELPRFARELFDRIESEKKAFTFDPGFV